MTNNKQVYEKKSFTKKEWKKVVSETTLFFGSKDDLSEEEPCIEPSIPHLLLNYFIVSAYEESSIRMAKELGIIKNNKEASKFNEIYRISERAYVKELIKKGLISKAINEINERFGIEVLEKLNSESESGDSSNNEDLHFRLLLLNLIEMIRKHHQDSSNLSENKNNDFILELIEYSQEKLALKACSNKEYIKELELVMTLLLFPMENVNDDSGNKIKLPKGLKDLYSLSLRSRIADLVNDKLLQCIHPQVLSQSVEGNFPDFVGNNMFAKSSNSNDILTSKPRDDIRENTVNDSLSCCRDELCGPLGSNSWNKSNWSDTSAMLREYDSKLLSNAHSSTLDNDQFLDRNESKIKYEAKLIHIMKLWAWCENQLHAYDIGVPRVEYTI